MIAFSLTNIKDFMSHLLLNETYDHFSFIEGEITTFNTFHIDGFIKKEFFDSNSVLPEYSYWKNVRNFCFSLIKGKRTPLAFQFVFSLAPKNIELLEKKDGEEGAGERSLKEKFTGAVIVGDSFTEGFTEYDPGT